MPDSLLHSLLLDKRVVVGVDGVFLGPVARIDADGGITLAASEAYAAFLGPDALKNARRTSACVNACRGIDTDNLIHVENEFNSKLASASEIIARLVTERDEALATAAILATSLAASAPAVHQNAPVEPAVPATASVSGHHSCSASGARR